jgi:amino acid transporter
MRNSAAAFLKSHPLSKYGSTKMSEVEPLTGEDAGHAGHLKRRLGTFANLAMTYSGVGAAAGIWSLFGFSLGVSGGTMLWGWVGVGLAMGLISLLWAELAAHYPYAGVAYQWSAILRGRRIGWWVGWVYLFGLIWVLTSYYFIVQQVLIPLAGLSGTQGQIVGISLITLIVAAAFNAAGIDFLGRLTKYGVIAELGVFVAVSILVAIRAPHHQSLSVVFDRIGTSTNFHGWLSTFFAGGIFVALWVQFSFENGGTLGEETIDAHRKAPRAVLGAWAVTFVAGLLFILVILTAMPDRKAVAGSLTPVNDVIGTAIGHTGLNLYLVLILFITVLGANAYFAGAVRHLFSMARDGMLPGHKFLSRTRESNGAPYGAVIAIAAITALPFVASRTFAVLVTGAVAVMYVGYFLMLCVLLSARLKGWPFTRQEGLFSLGRWGTPLTVFGVLYSGAMVINLMWPRPATNPDKFGLPVAWWLLGLPVVIGGLYYAASIVRRVRSDEVHVPGGHAPASAKATSLDWI